MIWTNFKIALRNLLRSKGYSAINIFGLAIGMAITILLLLWVNYELSWDKHYPRKEKLYQVVNIQTWDGTTHPMPNIPGPLIDVMKATYPQIKYAANFNSFGTEYLIRYGSFEKSIQVKNADPDFFKIFSVKFIKGDAASAFSDLHSVVLTESLAKEIFREEEPMGKLLSFDNKELLKVTGVVADVPKNSSYKYKCLAPFDLLRTKDEELQRWGSNMYFGFVELNDGVAIEAMNKRLLHTPAEMDSLKLSLYPIVNKHLYHFDGEETAMKQVRLYSIIALFILLIACFNFMNLSTARAAKRAKEIGLKKTVGASRLRLVFQFIGESLLVSFVAVNFALLIASLCLPVFNNLMGRELVMEYGNPLFWLLLLCVILVTGVLAGLYPAIYLTKFQPMVVLKGVVTKGNGGKRFRQILVVLQYTISVTLIISTMVVGLQVRHLRNLNMGMDIKNVVTVPLTGKLMDNRDIVRRQLLDNPAIQSVSFASHNPCEVYSNGWGNTWQGKDPDYRPLITYLCSDFGYPATFNLKMVEGRYFSEQYQAADSNAVVINECLAKMITKGSAVGQIITSGSGYQKRVIGVVKDFNFTHVSQKIGPLLIYDSKNYNYLFVRVDSKSIPAALSHIQTVCRNNNPEFPVNNYFVEDYLSYMYQGDEKSMRLLLFFSFLALVISSLGLVGLASFMAEERTKEIGVRKIMGASVSGLVGLFSFDFTKWVLLANVLAWPVAYYFLDGWLSNFAYRLDMPWWVFLAVALLVFVIAFLTVSYQSYRSANQNPVVSIKYE